MARNKEKEERLMSLMDDVMMQHRLMEPYVASAVLATRVKSSVDLKTNAQELINLCSAMVSSLKEITEP